MKQIAAAVREKFVEARNAKFVMHDLDLKRWALQESRAWKISGPRRNGYGTSNGHKI